MASSTASYPIGRLSMQLSHRHHMMPKHQVSPFSWPPCLLCFSSQSHLTTDQENTATPLTSLNSTRLLDDTCPDTRFPRWITMNGGSAGISLYWTVHRVYGQSRQEFCRRLKKNSASIQSSDLRVTCEPTGHLNRKKRQRRVSTAHFATNPYPEARFCSIDSGRTSRLATI